ncbi:double-strand break repair protein MRE11 [Pancytospora epiphaga]|nr:double-strand break repair protein MRE11 [Pancytospora epiphaga]
MHPNKQYKAPMKILITSDNHLGYKETDPVRGDDPFNTFEEILQIAHLNNVDFILQGGDFFDENKPSRNTYNKTIQLLRRYCFSKQKSDIKFNIPLNSDDGSISVGLPVLCIHGNHDDPSGFNIISPLDILHSAGLVSYFGRQTSVESIVIEPILLERGGHRLAIYGLGYMKGRLIYRAFKAGRVHYSRPEGDDWYSILVVHQDRVPRGEEHLPEDFIDPFFDLVVYGHEHESIKFRHKNFDVIQCGSTVRTSLCDYETHDKYVYILNLSETTPIKRVRLQTIRPFLMETMKTDVDDPGALIKSKLEEMAGKARINHRMDNSDGIELNTPSSENQVNLYIEHRNFIKFHSAQVSEQPLLRLRVELNSNASLNKHQLQQHLHGIAANPQDVLRITRRNTKGCLKPLKPNRSTSICQIYGSILKDLDLYVLSASRVTDALSDYIFKDAKGSFSSLLGNSISSIVEHFDHDNTVLEDVTRMIKNVKNELYKNNTEEGVVENEPIVDTEDMASCDESNNDILGLPTEIDTSVIFQGGKETLGNLPSSELASAHLDFTFIEEKQAALESKAMIECFKDDPTIKKSKKNDSDSDILAFMNVSEE